MNKLRAVIALGSKALWRDGEATPEAQKVAIQKIGDTVAKLSQKYELIIVHNNEPQLSNIMSPQAAIDDAISMTQGQIGYWLTQAIDNALMRAKHRRKVASLVTQVVVDRNDPAFRHPSKPVGQYYTAKEAVRLAKLYGWEMREDSGRGYHRIVPSPEPLDIVEKQSILSLLDSGTIVVAAGGGGVPVARTKVLKTLKSVEAVVDADLAAERLAELVKADLFVSLTDVPNAYLNYGRQEQIALGFISPAEISSYAEQGHFTADSMLPKIQAAIRFAAKHKISIVASPKNLESALARRSGTIIQ